MGRQIAAVDPALCGPLVSMQCIKYAMSELYYVKQVFLNKFLNLRKLDVLCPGRFVFWTFCKMDVW